MKVIAVVFALVAVAVAAPQYSKPPKAVRVTGDASKDAVIVRYDNDSNFGSGSYSYGVEASDGQIKEERGELVDAGTKDPSIAVQGRYSYPGPDGVLYEVVYVADKDGFRAQGAHLPVGPSVA